MFAQRLDSVPEIVPHYNAMDLRVAWRPGDSFEWAVIAQNLLDDSHAEYAPSPTGGVRTEVPTGIYTVITFKH